MNIFAIQLHRWTSYFLLFLLTLTIACQGAESLPPSPPSTPSSPIVASPSPQSVAAPAKQVDDAQLVDVQTISPNIKLDIRYATKKNFTHQTLYSQARCVLRGAVARKLAQVQADLESQGLGLKVYDCYRPLSVQKQMWEIMPDDRYVANPAVGSRHNRGSAVDVTLVDRTGKELEMPTEFDDFTDRAHGDYAGASPVAKQHRQLLKRVMEKHGFIALPTEWWHFDAAGWQQFPLLDVPMDRIPD